MQLPFARPRLLAVVSVAVVLIGAGSASAATKPYALTIAPATVTSGTVTMTATFTNENGPGGQQLGSANLFAPAAFSVTSATVGSGGTASLASNCTYGSLSGPCVQLRNLGVPPGGTTKVTMTVRTPNVCAANYSWTAEVKQSNDFSGLPGNDLSFDAANSRVKTTVDGACALAFLTQPASADAGQTITGNAYDPSGPPVAVEFVDQNGNVVSSASGPVTIALASNPGGATLSGTTTVNASGGVASFSTLSLDQIGYGYSLAASSPGVSGVTSSTFDIHNTGGQTTCSENQNCTGTATDTSTGQGTGTSQSLSVTATFDPNNPDAGTLTVNLDHGVSYFTSNVGCAGYQPVGADTDVFNMTASTRGKQLTDTVVTAVPNLTALNQLIASQQYCLAAPYPFVGASGPATATTLPNGSPGFIALLADCSAQPNQPCVSSRSGTLQGLLGSISIAVSIPAGESGDPYGSH